MKIMLADDEQSIRTLIGRIIGDEGYDFCQAQDGEQALKVFDIEQPDLLILDVMMPKLNGFEVCSELRKNGIFVPIIFLSAKGDIVDKSIGFKAGADDYLVKPFSSEELLLRISALLRRRDNEDEFSNYQKKQSVVKIGDLEVNFKRYEVLLRGEKIDLTPKEYKIIAFLATHPGEVFTREQLSDHLWGQEIAGGFASITVFVRKIREKIEDDPSRPKYLQTVWRIGYKLGE